MSTSEPRAWYRLSAAERAALQSAGQVRTWPAGSTITPQGNPPGSMYVLLTGCVKITVSNSRGSQAPIAVRGPGDVVGELAPISGLPRTAAITTITPVQALTIPRPRLLPILESHPHISSELLRAAAIRLQQSDHLRLESGGPDFTQRLAAVLLELAHQCTPNPLHNGPITLPVTQEELASFARVSRSTLIRGLETLRNLHLLQTSRRRTTIPSLQPLRDFAAGKDE